MNHEDWKPGGKVHAPPGKWLELDLSKLDTTSVYKLVIGSVVPRPIAFVSTLSAEGHGNLAPFSYFNAVSSDPPCLMVSITRKNSGEKKDTLRNIEATGEFVVNIVSEWMVAPMNHCSAEYPYGVNEMEKVGLTPVPSVLIKPPRVAESAIQMECKLEKIVEIGEAKVGASSLVIGRIALMHVHEGAYDQGRIRPGFLKPISRLGGLSYGRTTDIFELPRPKV